MAAARSHPAPSRTSGPRRTRCRSAPARRAGAASSRSRREPPSALGADPPQRAVRAARVARDARTPAVANEQHVRLVGLLAVAARQAQELVVRLFERGPLAPQAEARADAEDVRV